VKKVAYWILGGVTLLLMAIIIGLTMAHITVVSEMPVLPGVSLLQATDTGGDYAVRLSYVNTASQEMPRSLVLDPDLDPNPQAPYVMSHPAFVLEWSDGRILLVDAGMTREAAAGFGRPLEWAGAKPIQPHGSTAEQLGEARSRVKGVIFTHLHVDHVGGIEALCEGRSDKITAFMTEAQAERPNYTTRPGLKIVRDAGCIEQVRLKNGPIFNAKGFPGVMVLAAGGHTPGSQIVVARVGSRWAPKTYVFAGDLANNIDGINHNVPKPFLYSLLIVPESRARLNELRLYLRGLRSGGRFNLLVSHDQLDLEASGLPRWSPPARAVLPAAAAEPAGGGH